MNGYEYDFDPDSYRDSIRRLCSGYVLAGRNGHVSRFVQPLDPNLASKVREHAAVYLARHENKRRAA